MRLFLTKSQEQQIEATGYSKAIKDILMLKDKIYFKPVTVGPDATILNASFIGCDPGIIIKDGLPTVKDLEELRQRGVMSGDA